GEWLEVFYAQPLLAPSAAVADAVAKVVGYTGGNQAISLTTEQSSEIAHLLAGSGNSDIEGLAKSMAASRRPLVATLLATDTNPASVPEAYLKLHLLSYRLVKPHNTVLTGIFGVLPN